MGIKKPLPLLLVMFFVFAMRIAEGQTLQDGQDAYQKEEYKKAFQIWKPLAKQGNGLAQRNLATMYREGKGVTKNFKEAFKWYSLSAEQGNADAQYFIGYMYSDGAYGVTKNYKKGVKWLLLSAEQGNVSAQRNLGTMYRKGDGKVIQSYQKAFKWYSLAAEQGDSDSQYNLGSMYALGRGTIENKVESYKWLRIADENGFKKAKIGKDAIRKRMTSSQKEEANSLAREWLKNHRD